LGSVTRTVKPSCQLSHTRRFFLGLRNSCVGDKGVQDRFKFMLQAGMEHRVGAAPYSLHSNSSRGRMEQAHEFGCALPQKLVKLADKFALRLSVTSGVGYLLKQTGLIYFPHQDAHLLTFSVCTFDQIISLGIGVGDLNHFITLALAFDPADRTPTANPLLLKASLLENLPAGVGVHLRQPIRSTAQSSL
jgi:hypothetical protein